MNRTARVNVYWVSTVFFSRAEGGTRGVLSCVEYTRVLSLCRESEREREKEKKREREREREKNRGRACVHISRWGRVTLGRQNPMT